MWDIKIFETVAQMMAFIERNEGQIQYHEIAVNNAYGIRYRKLRMIG